MVSCSYYNFSLRNVKRTQNNAIDFKFFVQGKHVSLYAFTCSLSQLDVNINHMKFFKFEIFKQKATREMIHLKII